MRNNLIQSKLSYLSENEKWPDIVINHLVANYISILVLAKINKCSVTGFSNLFTGSALNTLDLYMKYTAEVVPLRTYIVGFTSVQR